MVSNQIRNNKPIQAIEIYIIKLNVKNFFTFKNQNKVDFYTN
ncbi:hypothetical protein J573_1107 [Acinetobacter baumannii 1546444]|nr:hypothetical protein J573_1107 [Acinetobacter baumannii 1546444]